MTDQKIEIRFPGKACSAIESHLCDTGGEAYEAIRNAKCVRRGNGCQFIIRLSLEDAKDLQEFTLDYGRTLIDEADPYDSSYLIEGKALVLTSKRINDALSQANR